MYLSIRSSGYNPQIIYTAQSLGLRAVRYDPTSKAESEPQMDTRIKYYPQISHPPASPERLTMAGEGLAQIKSINAQR